MTLSCLSSAIYVRVLSSSHKSRVTCDVSHPPKDPTQSFVRSENKLFLTDPLSTLHTLPLHNCVPCASIAPTQHCYQVFPLMKLLSSILLFSTSAKAFSSPSFVRTTLRPTAAAIQTRLMSSSNKPFAVIVEAEILPERMDEFLKLIKTNAENTRKEPGCLRFGTYP